MTMMPQEWSISALSVELDMTRRTIAKRIADVPPSSGEGRTKKYRLADVMASLIASEASGKMNDQARLLKARADAAEFEVQRLHGTMVPAAEVEAAWHVIAGRFKQRILAIPTRIAPLAAVETEVDACHEIADVFCREALAELAATQIENTPPEENQK